MSKFYKDDFVRLTVPVDAGLNWDKPWGMSQRIQGHEHEPHLLPAGLVLRVRRVHALQLEVQLGHKRLWIARKFLQVIPEVDWESALSIWELQNHGV